MITFYKNNTLIVWFRKFKWLLYPMEGQWKLQGCVCVGSKKPKPLKEGWEHKKILGKGTKYFK